MIRYENIQVTFGEFVAVPDLNLDIHQGEFFTLLGPSGCGKTTALRTLAGFVRPSAGRVHVDDVDVTRLSSDKRGVGMVFQNYALFPSMNVWENIAFGLKVRKESRSERDRLVREIAERVDLSEEQLAKNLDELSGGQQQRVAIARALVLQPKILLLDEPLSNLDAKLRHQLRSQLKELQHTLGITTVYVTHDQDEALTMSDRIAVFHDGVVEQIGTPQEVYDSSATEFVCTFIGDSSKLGTEFLTALSDRGASLHPGLASYLRVEKASLRPGPGTLPIDGTVRLRSYHGLYSNYTIQSHGSLVRLLVKHDVGIHPEVGAEITVHVDPAHVLQYDDNGNRAAAALTTATVSR